MKRAEMVMVVKTAEAVKEAFEARTNQASMALSYGEPVELGTVRAKGADGYEAEKAVKAFRVLSFSVPDTALGVQTVAMTCGHGVPSSIDDRNYNFQYYVDELDLKSVKNGRIRFGRPVLALSRETAGYRQVWGGVESAFTYDLDVDDPDDEMATNWFHTVFVLRTNLKDGGVLVQSSSSGAYIQAEKKGHEWTLTLYQPVTEDDRIAGRGYEGIFRAGYNYYCDKSAHETR